MISLPNGAIRRTSDATPPTGAGGVPTLGDGDNAGILYPLGSIYKVPATRTARGLLVVDSAGALREGLHPDDSDVASTDVVVNIEADSGDLELIYVKNVHASNVIQRGHLCIAEAPATKGPYAVTTGANSGVGPSQVVGVALYDIPVDKCGWIARKGQVYVESDAAVSAGAQLTNGTGTAGQSQTVAAVTNDSFGFAVTAAAGADTLFLAQVNCRG